MASPTFGKHSPSRSFGRPADSPLKRSPTPPPPIATLAEKAQATLDAAASAPNDGSSERKQAPAPAPAAVPKAKPAPSPADAYVFKPWHTALIFSLAFLLDIPFLVEQACTKQYPVWKSGAILVTGASTGIGRDAAVALAKRNYTVYAGVRAKSDFSGLVEFSPNIHPVLLDVTSDRSIDAAYRTILKDISAKKIDFVGLVNNAGISQSVTVEFHASRDIEKIFNVNVFGAVKVTQRFLPLLRESKGRIINISSLLGFLTIPEFVAYSASKHALEAFSHGLRRELMPLDVSVSIIEPGFVQSPIHDKVHKTQETSGSAVAKKVYPHLYTAKRAQKQERNINKASSTKVTSNAILHAMTDTHPRPRVPVANVGGVPGVVIAFLAHIFPDRLLDFLLTE